MTSRTQGSASASEPSTGNIAAPAQPPSTDGNTQPASTSADGDSVMDVQPSATSNADAVQEEPPTEEASAAADLNDGEEASGKDMSPAHDQPTNGRKTSSNSSRKSSQVPKGQSRSRSKSAKASSSRDDNGEEGVVATEAMTESPHAQVQDVSIGAQEEAPLAVPMSRRQRSSSSSVKALAGLGLAHLGDGDDGSLAPRRTRRAAATSPSAAGNTLKKEEEGAAEDEDPADGQEQDDAKAEGVEDYDEEAEGDADGDIEGVTRCVCGSEDENVGLMIQCETCKCWQHCVCMGMHTEEDCPDVYYCEQCKPELHIPLLRALGLLPPAAKGHKKSSKNSKQASRESMKELMQARDAVALLAQQNAQRRREGQEVVVAHPTANTGKRAGEGRRNTSESAHDQESRSNRGNSDVPASPRGGAPGADRRSPKRRSTMNSRDSGYGWEPIPPGLLNEDEVWDDVRPKKEDEEGSSSGRKRKRTGGSRRDEEQSPSPAVSPPMGPAELAKRRRMSGSATASSNAPNNGSNTSRGEGRRRSPSDAVEASIASVSSQGTGAYVAGSGKKVGGGATGAAAKAGDKKLRDDSSAATSAPAVKAKQPNQYTYRKERLANGGSANLANGGNGIVSAGRTVSPTPSPSKSGRRGAAALREGSTMGSRTSTPAPGDVRVGGNSRNSNLPGGAWGLPEHLSHLVNLLPTSQPEPLTLHLPSTKGLSNPRSGAAKDHHAENSSSSRPSPHPFTIVDVSEPPTKVRWPPKRMTMGEMRKRVRNISEYVTNKQLEAVERGKRMKDLGIEILGPTSDPQSQGEAVNETGGAAAADLSDAMEGVEATNGSLERSSGPDSRAPASADRDRIPLSMKLMDELTRELIAFQQKFGVPPGSMAVLGAGLSSFASGTGGAIMTAASTAGPETTAEVAGGPASDGAAATGPPASTTQAKTNGTTGSAGGQQQDTAALALSPDMAAAVVATAGEEGVTA